MGIQPSEVPNQRVNEAQHMRERTPQRYSNSPVTCQIIYWYHMCRMCLVSSDPQAVENTMPHPTADTNKDEETHSAHVRESNAASFKLKQKLLTIFI